MRPNSTKGDMASGLPASFTYIRIFSLADMILICQEAKILTRPLRQAVKSGNRKMHRL